MNDYLKNSPHMASPASLEAFLLEQEDDRGNRYWRYDGKALIFYAQGYEAIYRVPNWSMALENVSKYYDDYAISEDGLLDALVDTLHEWYMTSRG